MVRSNGLHSGTGPDTYTYVGPNNSLQTVQVNYSNIPQRTNFGCPNVTEIQNLPWNTYFATSIVMPDGERYGLSYESTPNYPGSTTGRLARITLPNGGSISFGYSGGHHGMACNVGEGTTLTRTVDDGNGHVNTWTYVASPRTQYETRTVTVTEPSGSTILYTFTGSFQTQKIVKDAQNNVLSTTNTCYNYQYTSQSTCVNYPGHLQYPISETALYTYIGSAAPSLVETLFDAAGNVSAVKRYDTGATYPPSGSPVSETDTTHANVDGACGPVPAYIHDRPCSVTTRNASGATLEQMTYIYDAAGHPTQTSAWTGTRWLTSSATYNANGTTATVTDAKGTITTFGYNGAGGCNNLLLTSESVAGMTSTQAWNCDGAVNTSSTDVNNNTTYYTYGPQWQLTSTQFPDGGQATVTYNLTASPPNIVTSQKINASGNWLTNQTNFDGLGRPARKMLTSDPQGTVYSDISYNNMGQIQCVTNPYRTTSDATYGSTCYQYDPLGRRTVITNPDNSTELFSYSSLWTKVEDEGNGTSRVTRLYQQDRLGRLAAVCEVSNATQLGAGGAPVSCGAFGLNGFLTTYTYDALDRLTSVTQNGLNNRTYAYDMLSRLTSETNPESGTRTYSYDTCSAGDLCSRTSPKPNQTGSATVVTSYTYDPLHRLTGKSYNDNLTGSANYYYDQTAPWGWNIPNPKGHLTSSNSNNPSGTQPGAEMFTYDSMDRILLIGIATPMNWSGNAYHLAYTYDYLGNVQTAVNDRENATYTSTYDTAGRLIQFGSSLSDANHPGTLFTVNQYNPMGQIQQATFGNGIVRNNVYDNRGRLTSQTDGTVYNFSLNFRPNSNIFTGSDSINGNWTYTYDDFDRIATSSKTGQSFNYQYDRFGNRWQQNAPQGGPAPQYLFDANNHITGSGITYDAAGNITSAQSPNGTHTFTYDAEGRMLTVDGGSTASYVYDAFGQRVEGTINGSARDFIYDQNGRYVTAVTSSSWIRSELYAGNMHVATYGNNTTYFMHKDWLGTIRNQTGVAGQPVQPAYSLPFGDAFGAPGSSLSWMYFAGLQWDGETYLDHASFRDYNPTQGRWMTPDPAGIAAVDPSNPQTWNRYAYVVNNVVNLTDASGLDGIRHCWSNDGFHVQWTTDGSSCAGSAHNSAAGNLALLGGFASPLDVMTTVTGQERTGSIVLTFDTGSLEVSYYRNIYGNIGISLPDRASGSVDMAHMANNNTTNHVSQYRPTVCSLTDLLIRSSEFSARAGFDVKLANIGRLGGSFFKNLTTGETGADAGVQAGIGYQIGTASPKGTPMTTPSPVTHSFLAGPYQRNITTGETTYSLGLVALIGGDVTFKPKTFKTLASACTHLVE